jgi:hypothetical protein
MKAETPDCCLMGMLYGSLLPNESCPATNSVFLPKIGAPADGDQSTETARLNIKHIRHTMAA